MTKIIKREPTPEELADAEEWNANEYNRKKAAVTELRRQAYQLESDPIFFQWQRGETYTEQDWKNKVTEIDERYPYPTSA